MRTEVKLGLAVGSILFAVVIVYVLFFAGGNKDQAAPRQPGDGAAVAVVPSSTANPPTAAASPSATANPSFTTVTPYEPAAAPTTQPSETASAGDSPDTHSVSTLSTPASSGTFNWRTALQGDSTSTSTAARSATPSFASSTTPPVFSGADQPVVGGSTFNPVLSPATRPSSGPRTYVVKAGETYWSIAEAEYGSAAFYPHIARANPKVPAAKLRSGMKIMLPAREDVVPAGAAATVATASQPLDPLTQYRVQPGDSLHGICKALYGKADPDRVNKLYALNKELIGPNQNALRPKMVLRLPEPPTNTGNAEGNATRIVSTPLQ